MESDLAAQIRDLMALFQQAEWQAKQMLTAARAQGLSFGLDYNHFDDEVARLIGRLRHMELIANRHPGASRAET
jgi:hypothetical protein